MTSTDLLVDAFERIRDAVHPAVNGLSPDELAFRPDAESNSIAWLVWHLTRIQDDRVAGLDAGEQVWTAQGWAERFASAPRPTRHRLRPRPDHGGGGCRRCPVPARLLRGRPQQDARVRALAQRGRPRPSGGPNLGSAGDGEFPPGQRHGRRPPARRPGRLCPGHHPAPLSPPVALPGLWKQILLKRWGSRRLTLHPRDPGAGGSHQPLRR